jgi:hypothetical protein
MTAVPALQAVAQQEGCGYIPGREKLCPGKLTLGKILSEIPGQYFYQGFKPCDRIFPAVF